MNISRFGGASLKVRNLEASARFYCKVLGLPLLSRTGDTNAIELGVGKSHRFALECVNASHGAAANQAGLPGIAFVVGNTPRTLEEAAEHLSAEGVAYERVVHEEYDSLLLHDPDGHVIELYYWPEW